MASNNRATQINKVLKIAKKHYQPTEIPSNRTVLEQLIYACCSENSLYDVANDVFVALSNNYYDWNEVRVTSIRELSDVMKTLNDPEESATRLKRVLQSVFETHYTFDLEPLKKQNIGQTVKQLEKYNGTTSYTVAFVTQNALGGHSIPINQGLLEAMRVVGVISDAEASKGSVTGLERAVPKTKGTEIGTILHQLGVELHRSPYGPTIRKLLLEIEPTCKDRLPKRSSKKTAKIPAETMTEPPAEKVEAASETKKKTSTNTTPDKSSTDSKKPKTKKPAAKSSKPTTSKKKAPATRQTKTKQTKTKKPATKKPATKKPTTKKSKTTKKKATTKKKTTTKKKPTTTKKKTTNKKLTKRKPR